MAETVHDADTQLLTTLLTISGTNDPGTTAPESINAFPFWVTWPDTCEWGAGPAGTSPGNHTLKAELHWPFRQFPTNVAEAKSFGESIKNAIFGDLTLNGTVDNVKEVRATFGPLGYGTIETFGWAIEVDIDIKNEIT